MRHKIIILQAILSHWNFQFYLEHFVISHVIGQHTSFAPASKAARPAKPTTINLRNI